jgi:quinoprotein relay system zinc metallohydrolase 2
VSRIVWMAGWIAAWAVVSAATAAAAAPEMTLEEVAPGHYVHRGTMDERSAENLGDQANIGFVVGERCVAVIDPGGSLAVGKALKAAMRRVTDKPVCHVVITHFHPDHFFGAAAFREPGVQFVAHAGYARTMAVRSRPYLNALRRDLGAAADGSEIVPPTMLVERVATLDLGGRTLELRAWNVAHTDNDLTVFDASTGTLWLGDLLFVDHTPVVDGSIRGFIEVLDELARLPARVYVPGHGRTDAPWPDGLMPERTYLKLVLDETRAALKRKRTIEEAVNEVGVGEASRWVNFEAFHRRNVTTTYTELEWEE